MSAFDQLDPLVQHHIVNSLEWRSLRPLQEQSIAPLLSGSHCLLLAPTAGGKTEAALFPIFSTMVREKWTGLSVLYVCPLKALLNNLQQRLSGYAGLLGRCCEVWHGDVATGRKDHIRKAPPDILLTTPESLEGMLVSINPLGREMLGTVRVVVVDEIHHLAGDDRGWHLLCLLERVVRLSGREIQRIGLSATVGNPEELLGWFAGHCRGRREVIAPDSGSAKTADVLLDYVGSLENAALVISRLHRGEKRLVFCDSRSRVEQLASFLRSAGVETYLSHSSLSAEERRSAEKAFAEARNCVIVATSTLELGIDVGDLDRVIQIDAPNSVASFLQRLGRTGRRAGSRRNCLFLTTSERALIKAAGLLNLWRSGFVEPIQAPPLPLHILSQQWMALVLQRGGLGVIEWRQWIGRLPPFATLDSSVINELLEFLKSKGILFENSGSLGFGTEGESRFGRRHFLELLSVFTSPAMLTAVHGLRELGLVEAGFLMRAPGSIPARIALAGRSWLVREIDWRSRRVHVEPSDELGRGAWIGSQQGLSFAITRAIKGVMTRDDMPADWSTRAQEAIQRVRESFRFLDPEAHTLVVHPANARMEWFTFAGTRINQCIAERLEQSMGVRSVASDLAIEFPTSLQALDVLKALAQLEPEDVRNSTVFDDRAIEALKFGECLPPRLQQMVLRSRLPGIESFQEVLAQRTLTKYVGSVPGELDSGMAGV